MKVMFISDIHGMITNLDKISERFHSLGCQKLVVLGDLYYADYYHRLEEVYQPKEVLHFLKSFADKLICIRGNCDSDLDIMESEFPIEEKILHYPIDSYNIYLTHGHIYNECNWKEENSILIFGHYHYPFIKEDHNNLFINPGSISLPRNNSTFSYLYYDGDSFTIYDLHNHVIAKKELDDSKKII